MKILIIGFVALLGWSSLSTHFYVCKIKGLCDDQSMVITNIAKPEKVVAEDSSSKPNTVEPIKIPGSMIIYFAFDKTEFDPGTISDQYLDESNKYLDQNRQAVLNITGHTDDVGSDEYNQALGLRRTQSVKSYFASRGIPAIRIVLESKGEKEPAENNKTTEGRATNRRTVITIKK